MSAIAIHEPLLGELDHVRLSRLAEAARCEPLSEVLDAAEVVPARTVPDCVVTMYSRAVVTDRASRERRVLTVCYPHDAEPASGFVSVLLPIGAALLGRCVGSTVSHATPSGETRTLVVEEILFQPESSGDYTL